MFPSASQKDHSGRTGAGIRFEVRMFPQVAEADGNRTRQAEDLGLVGFEDRGGHQAPTRLQGRT